MSNTKIDETSFLENQDVTDIDIFPVASVDNILSEVGFSEIYPIHGKENIHQIIKKFLEKLS